MTRDSTSSQRAGHRYFCRGCGKPLENTKASFHAECLEKDKRWRIREQDRRDRDRLAELLAGLHCPTCGESLEDLQGHSQKARLKLQAAHRRVELGPDDRQGGQAGTTI